MSNWKNFKKDIWTNEINVENFILTNYTKYDGDESFLEDKTNKTDEVWNKCQSLLKEELKKGVL